MRFGYDFASAKRGERFTQTYSDTQVVVGGGQVVSVVCVLRETPDSAEGPQQGHTTKHPAKPRSTDTKCTLEHMAQTAGVYEWISGRVYTSEEVGWMMHGHGVGMNQHTANTYQHVRWICRSPSIQHQRTKQKNEHTNVRVWRARQEMCRISNMHAKSIARGNTC